MRSARDAVKRGAVPWIALSARILLRAPVEDWHVRPSAGAVDRRVLRPVVGLRALLREALMSSEYAIALAISVLLLVYLGYALLKPERF